jgi:hypothetical protein
LTIIPIREVVRSGLFYMSVNMVGVCEKTGSGTGGDEERVEPQPKPEREQMKMEGDRRE